MPDLLFKSALLFAIGFMFFVGNIEERIIKLIILAECFLLAQIFCSSRVASVGFDFT